MNSLKRRLTKGRSEPSSPTIAKRQPRANTVEIMGGGMLHCHIALLHEDQQDIKIDIKRDAMGQTLFDRVCEELGGLQEKDYFGLRFTDKDKQWQWLDLGKTVYKQLKHVSSYHMKLRVKHYPSDPVVDLKQYLSRYLLYLQLRRDFMRGRLLCESDELYQLGGLVVHAELGNYEEMEDKDTYLSEFKFVHNQTAKIEEKVKLIHAELAGLTSTEAESEFINKTSKLDTYGVVPFQVKDVKGNMLYLGLTHHGVVTFQGSRRTHLFRWSEISRFTYDAKTFAVHIPNRGHKKNVVTFKCDSKPAAAALWKMAVDQQCFFSLNQASEAKPLKSGGGLFRRSHTFMFSGRCQKEALNTSANLTMDSDAELSRLRSGEGDSGSKYATFPRRLKKTTSNCTYQRNTSDEIVSSSTPLKLSGIYSSPSSIPAGDATPSITVTSPTPAEVVDEVLVMATANPRVEAAPPPPPPEAHPRDVSPVHKSADVDTGDHSPSPVTEIIALDRVGKSPHLIPEDERPLLSDQDDEESLLLSRDNSPLELPERRMDNVLTVQQPLEQNSTLSSSVTIWSNFHSENDTSIICHNDDAAMVTARETFDTNFKDNEDSFTKPKEVNSIFQSALSGHELPRNEYPSNGEIHKRSLGRTSYGGDTSSDSRDRERSLSHERHTNVKNPDGKRRDKSEDDEEVTPVAIWKILLVFLFMLTMLCLFGIILFFEAEIHSDFLNFVRSHRATERFFVNVYKPWRHSILSLVPSFGSGKARGVKTNS